MADQLGVIEDTREIRALISLPPGGYEVHIGASYPWITKIEAYAEAGPMGYQPAFLVWADDKLIQRIIGGAWRVIYA